MARPLIDPGMARPIIYPYISIYNLYIRKIFFSLIRTVSVLIGGEPRSRGWVWPSLLEFPYIYGLVIHGSILFHILVWLSTVSVLYYILVWLSPDSSCPYLGLAIHSLSLVLYPGLAIPGSILSHILVWPSPDTSCTISWSGYPGFILYGRR